MFINYLFIVCFFFCVNLVYFRIVGVLGFTETMMFFMFVLCSILGFCWMVFWVRGEMGECWWEWEAGRLLLFLFFSLLSLLLFCFVFGDRSRC